MLKDIHHDATELAFGTHGIREGLELLSNTNRVELPTLHEAATQFVASVFHKAKQGDPNVLTGSAAAVLAALDGFANHEGLKRGIQKKAEEMGVSSPVTSLLGQDKEESKKATNLLIKIGNDPQLEKYLDKWNKVLAAMSSQETEAAATKHFQMLRKKLDDAYTAAGAEQKKARTVAGDVMAARPEIGTR